MQLVGLNVAKQEEGLLDEELCIDVVTATTCEVHVSCKNPQRYSLHLYALQGFIL